MAEKKISVFGDKLRGMQDTVNQAMADYKPGGVRVPDGIYTGRESAEMREAKSSGNLMISRQFTIVDGEFKGLNVWDNLVFQGNPIGIQIARRWMEQHGYAWPEEDLAEVETIVNEINEAGALVKFKVKSSANKNDPDRPWINVDVLEILEGGVEAQAEAEAGAADEEQVPGGPSDDDLIAFCAAQGVADVEEGMERADILTKMAEYTYAEAELTAEEIALLEAVELQDYIAKAAPPPPPKAAPAAAKKAPMAAQAKPVQRTTATHFGKSGAKGKR